MKMKRVIAIFLFVMTLFSVLPISAVEVAESGDIPVVLNAESARFNVTVPTVLPVDVDANGVVSVSTNNCIINNSFGPVKITSISVVPQNNWQLVSFDTDFLEKAVDLKEFGFELNDAAVPISGVADVSVFPVISGNTVQQFTYNTVVATQSVALKDFEIAQVIFTIGWNNALQNISPLSDWIFRETDEVIFLEKYIGTNSNVVIPAQYRGKPVVVAQLYTGANPDGVFYQNTDITSVVFEDGVTIENNNAIHLFSGCTSLVSVKNLPDSITNMHCTFINCSSLSDFTKVPSETTMMEYTFHGCTSLDVIPTLPNGVVNLTGAFAYCPITVSPVIPENVVNMYATFYACERLAIAPVIPNKVKNMESTFDNCTGMVTAPVIPFSVNNLRGTFHKCYSLTGELVIHANPADVTYCLANTSTNSGTNLILKGTSTMLNSILNTKYSNSNIILG